MRMSRQVQQNIFPEIGREVDCFRSGQFDVGGERWNVHLVLEILQAGDAAKPKRLNERAVRPECAIRQTELEIVTERPVAANLFRFHFPDRAILFAFEMQTARWNLFQMNFHFPYFPLCSVNFPARALATAGGTNLRDVAAEPRDLLDDS